jgi:serine/threonine protein phosphatase PrpC
LPDKPEEKERIVSSGGIVVHYGTWRVNGLLSVSRSIGDSSLSKFVTAVPTILKVDRTKEDEFIIIATDGLWDVIKHKEACEFIRTQLQEKKPRSEISKLITEEALRKRTNDNVTVVIIFFDPPTIS